MLTDIDSAKPWISEGWMLARGIPVDLNASSQKLTTWQETAEISELDAIER